VCSTAADVLVPALELVELGLLLVELGERELLDLELVRTRGAAQLRRMMARTSSREPTGNVLLHGLPGHPLHPPLTDATIGMFVLSSALAVIGAAGWITDAAGKACWLALIAGLVVAVPTAATGFADWVRLEWGSARWRTATLHLTAMVSAVLLYALAAWLQYDGYRHGDVTTGGLVFSLAGLFALTAGGWLGGAIVFVHGVRVLAADDPDRQDDHADSQITTTGR
jgi:uncharacterized membrane protein